MSNLSTPTQVSEHLGALYRDCGPATRVLVKGRPFICPFHRLMDAIPDGSRVLDVGCGTGVFLNLLASAGKLDCGLGIDANSAAIEEARRAAAGLDEDQRPQFEHRLVEQGLPDGMFDVVSMVDVVHHIDPAFQQQAIEDIVAKVREGGLFVFKDMRKDQVFRSTMNRLHDLVLAQDWITYVAGSTIESWVTNQGFERIDFWRENMLWYGHEALIFQRKSTQ